MKLEEVFTETLCKIYTFASSPEILRETQKRQEHKTTSVDTQTGKGGTRFSYRNCLASISTTSVTSDQPTTLSVNKSKRRSPNLSQDPSLISAHL